jgi:hypothetical protein
VSRRKSNVKDLPAEFFLPPQTNEALKKETIRLLAGCVAFLVILGIIVALTQGIVIKV